ncbi:MAG: hypothetical protein PHD72_03625 [Patescibacteria group bacterium]|nr:hypothetical protein [Patescibacteria group bacterium]
MNWKVMLASGLIVVAIFVAARICEEEARSRAESAQNTFSTNVPAKTGAVVERAIVPCSAEKACPKDFACNLTSHVCVPIVKQPPSKKDGDTAGDVDKLW